jgi:hypothetical protein
MMLSAWFWSASKTCPAVEQDMTENRDRFLDAGRRSAQEKSAVEMKAAAVAGNDNVINDLKVAPKN